MMGKYGLFQCVFVTIFISLSGASTDATRKYSRCNFSSYSKYPLPGVHNRGHSRRAAFFASSSTVNRKHRRNSYVQSKQQRNLFQPDQRKTSKSAPVLGLQGTFLTKSDAHVSIKSREAVVHCEERERSTTRRPFLNTTAALEGLLDKVESYCPSADQEIITRAFLFVQENVSKFCSCKKNSGTETRYLSKSIGVAYIIADMKLDAASIVTGLLHGIFKDTYDNSLHHDLLEEQFGPGIAGMVSRLSKVDQIHFYPNNNCNGRQKEQADNYRKMIVATAKDVRVVLVKLADQAHVARNLWLESSPTKQREVAQETLELFAPLAHRLGIYSLKTELEDTSLRYLEPMMYNKIQDDLAALQEKQQSYTDSVIALLQSLMYEAAGLEEVAEVTGRMKSLYSIYQKMQSKNLSFDKIQDIMAFRILVDDVAQCYQALGIVQAKWEPVPSRFKDYIARPKSNGYQSLHTTVIGPGGFLVEVQIRTREMHEIAESGVAAHWQYKAKGETKSIEDTRRFTWLRHLVDWVQQLNDPEEFVVRDDEDLFEKDVFVFSPQGDLLDLPNGSSVVDFAYRIHTELGNRCGGAKVNGKIEPLRYRLRNGDAVEIIVSSNQTPHRQWLEFVKTTKAKNRIKTWLKKQQDEEAVVLGRVILEKEFKKKHVVKQLSTDGTLDYNDGLEHILSVSGLRDKRDLLRALGEGQIKLSSLMKEISSGASPKVDAQQQQSKGELEDELVLKTRQNVMPHVHNPSSKNDGIVVGGSRSIMYSFCRECNPLYGEDVKGVVTQGRGIKVHRLDCKHLQNSNHDRVMDVVWDDEIHKPRKRYVQVEVVYDDQPGVLARMTKTISTLGIYVGKVVFKALSNNEHGNVRFDLMLSTIDELNKVTVLLRQEQGVYTVARRR